MSTSTASAPVDGRIESATDGKVIGWAWRQGVEESVDVEVLVEGEPVATVTADIRRRGLRRAGIGDGSYGFEAVLPEVLATGGEHRLEVVVLPDRVPLIAAAGYLGGSDSSIWNGTRFVPVEATAPAATTAKAPETPATLEPAEAGGVPLDRSLPGVVESVSGGFVTGWASEGERVIVTVDGVVAVKARAKHPRPDVEPGRSGFRAALSDSLRDGGMHLIGVEVKGEPLLATAHCLRPTVAPSDDWGHTDLRLALLDQDAVVGDAPRTVLGSGGWRFEEGPPPNPLDDDAITALAASVRDWEASHREMGVSYVFAVLPARERLERTHLPASMAVRSIARAVERLAEDLGGAAGGTADLLPVLDEARSERPVSLRTGSGLTAWGAFAAARAVLSAATDQVEDLIVPAPDGLQFGPVSGYRGNLAGRRAVLTEGDLAVELPLSAVPPEALGEETDLVAPGVLSALRAPTPAHLIELGEAKPAVFEREKSSEPRICLAGPSLPPVLVATVAEQAGRCLVLDRADPPLELIELEHPHVVLHVVRESDLAGIARGS